LGRRTARGESVPIGFDAPFCLGGRLELGTEPSGPEAGRCLGAGAPSSPDERHDRPIGAPRQGECDRPLRPDSRGRPLGHPAPPSSRALAARG